MKKILAILLAVGMVISMSACKSEKSTTNKTGAEAIDYSDIGFQNNCGITEWVSIKNYDFTSEEPYVEMGETLTGRLWNNEFYVLNFENGYIESRVFNLYGEYKGDRKKGKLSGLYKYTVVSNLLISLPDYSTCEITNVTIEENIPLISIKLTTTEYYSEYELPASALLIPSKFIDFDYEPEISQRVTNEYWGTKDTFVKYRIKKL